MGENRYVPFDEMMASKTNSRNTSYFSLKNGEEARVRFLYNELSEIRTYWIHRLDDPFATIACTNQLKGDNFSCKWCDSQVARSQRVFLTLYNEDKDEIQHWDRTVSYAQNTVVPILSEISEQGKPIVSQVYKIKRTGEGLKTTYNIIPTGQPDDKTKEAFGEIKDEYELGIIKPCDFDYEAYKQERNSRTNSNTGNYTSVPQPARRTTVF